MNSANFYFIHKNTNSVLNVYFEILQPVVHHSYHLYHMEKSENFRLIESIYIQEPIQMPVEKTYFPAIAIIKLKKKMVNLNSMVLTFDGPLYSDKIISIIQMVDLIVELATHMPVFLKRKVRIY